MYDLKTASALRSLGYEPDTDFRAEYADGVYSLQWSHADPQPSEQDITDRLASQAFLDWEAENGGDPTLTARRIVKEAIDDPAGKVLVALVKVMIDQGVIPATAQQVRNAIIAKIEAGEAD